MPFEILGISTLIIVALLLFIAGIGVFKLHPIVGLLAGIGVFLILLGVVLGAVFGSIGFIGTLLGNPWMQYLTVGGASYTLGTIIGIFT